MISAVQKNAIDIAIATNPTTVTITRVSNPIVDGAKGKVTTSVAAQVWLVYPKSPSASKINADGGNQDQSSWGALAPSSANVRWGSDVKDTFTVSGLGTFEVLSGRPICIGTTVNGYELDLKLVK